MDWNREIENLIGLLRYIIVGLFAITIIALVGKSLAEILLGRGLSWVGAVVGGIVTAAVYFFNSDIRNKLKGQQ